MPATYREAVGFVRTEYGMNERRACRLLGFDRSNCRYRSKRTAVSAALVAEMHRRASAWTTMGYHKLHGLVRASGFVISHRRFFRIYKVAPLCDIG